MCIGSATGQQAPPAEPVFRASSYPLAVDPAPSIPPAAPAPKKNLTPPLPPDVMPIQAQDPKDKDQPPKLSNVDATIQEFEKLLEPPSREGFLGHRDSEKMMEERMNQQAMQRAIPDTVKFPSREPISTGVFKQRQFPGAVEYREPYYVMYQPLYFEEKNAERFGWDLGFFQPAISVAYFYKDALLYPHNYFSHLSRRYETSAGWPLPGDPVPYILYPPEFTVTGSIAEAALVVGLFAIFP